VFVHDLVLSVICIWRKILDHWDSKLQQPAAGQKRLTQGCRFPCRSGVTVCVGFCFANAPQGRGRNPIQRKCYRLVLRIPVPAIACGRNVADRPFPLHSKSYTQTLTLQGMLGAHPSQIEAPASAIDLRSPRQAARSAFACLPPWLPGRGHSVNYVGKTT
jgi:hypothetical protein